MIPTNDTIVVECQWCGNLFLRTRPLFVNERNNSTCPACRAKAKRNTEEMLRKAKEISTINSILNRAGWGGMSYISELKPNETNVS